MPLNFGAPMSAGAGAALGLESLLEERFKKAIEAQKIKEFNARLALDQQRLAQDQSQFDRTQGLAEDKFGHEQQVYEEAAPQRAANLRYTGAQAADLEAQPARDAADEAYRAATLGMHAADIQARRNEAAEDRASSERMRGDGDVLALADMVANNPEELQKLTPTLTGAVMRAIASNPELRQTYQANGVSSIRTTSEKLLRAVDQLLGPGKDTLTSGAKTIMGEYTPPWSRDALSFFSGQEGSDALASLNQISGQAIINLIAEMKAQSRTGATGFGQLSEAELALLENAATQLHSRISEGRGLDELLYIRKQLMKVLGDDVTGAGPGPGASPGGMSDEDIQAQVDAIMQGLP